MFSLATLAETWSTMRSTPLPSVAASTFSDQLGSRRVDREIGAEFLEALAPCRIGRRADDEARAFQLGDLQAHEADARAGALDHHRISGLQAAGGDERVVHGLQGDRQRRRLLVAHVVGRDRRHAAPVGQRVLRVAAAARAHDAVTRLDGLDLAADRLDLAGELKSQYGSRSARTAVHMARRHEEVGPVETGRPHPHQDLLRRRLRFVHVADFDPIPRQHCGLHVQFSQSEQSRLAR